jgi:glycosyltransferase involved in cell wall biosynthesis
MELCWSGKDFRRLEAESTMADLIIVASTFTRNSLIENAIDPKRIVVVPYGTDDGRFDHGYFKGEPPPPKRKRTGSLRVIFVGQMGQRKGVRDLLSACDLFGWNRCELRICGRGFDLDPAALRIGSQSITIRRNLSNDDLAQEYRSADVMVLPSVLEGFGLVLLEAISFGVPVIATTNSGAPDIIQNEREGFIVPIRSPEAIASYLDLLWREPERRTRMSEAALCTSATLTWAQFRRGVSGAVRQFLASAL